MERRHVSLWRVEWGRLCSESGPLTDEKQLRTREEVIPTLCQPARSVLTEIKSTQLAQHYTPVCSCQSRPDVYRIHSFPRTDREPSVTLGVRCFCPSSWGPRIMSVSSSVSIGDVIWRAHRIMLVTSLLGLLCYPEHGGSKFLRSVCELLLDCTASHFCYNLKSYRDTVCFNLSWSTSMI
jgi:hypothetical protein